ncbi:Oxygen-independent coproporphyrinogen-III oxidase-like protein YggW [Nymphon striatum]|nr:Oxygen-independent coproporphyrinogen-III oxidase-like protein YggW [Nymphon striatum]
MTPIPLSLYIHIPWCIRKCPYCDFNSHQAPLSEQNTGKSSEQSVPEKRPIESIFIGGGTPSLFSAEAIDSLLAGLRERLPLRPSMEITLEANPGTFEQERFSEYRKAGINRLSIGVQIHDDQEAIKAAEIAKKAGFDNFNLDLMHGLPNQTPEQALADLDQALKCKPTHISWYQLTIEKNTLFHHSPPVLPNDEVLWDIQEKGQELLHLAGYEQYEVSAYAQGRSKTGTRQNRQCRHNINYWEFGDYVGIGAGAHGKVTQPDGSITRHQKFRHPAEYMEKAIQGMARSSTSTLEEKDKIFEFMLNALRLKEGFSADLFEQRTHLPFSTIEPIINSAIDKKLMQSRLCITTEEGIHPTTSQTQEKFATSEKGWVFLNDVMEMFL